MTNAVIGRIHRARLPEPATSLTFLCLIGFACGAITQRIGIHALFGFFLAGIMAGGAPSLPERTRQVIRQMVYAVFVPLFFVSIGLKVDFLANFDVFLVLLLCVIGISGRLAGAWFGFTLTRGDRVNRLPVAIAHIPGGVMEIVVGVLALEFGLITAPIFVAIVFSAVVSSMLLGPWLSRAISRRKRVSVLEYFSPRGIIPDLAVVYRDDAIRKLCDMAGEQEDVGEAEAVYAAVLAREREMGTAIEEGIAVPHARLPVLKKPVVLFGRSLTGIDWNSPDGNPTHHIFLILTPPQDDTQVQILGSIAKAMSVPAHREALMAAADRHGIWEALQRSIAEGGVIHR